MPSHKKRQRVQTMLNEQQIQKIRLFDPFFIMFRIFGLTERPSVLVSDRISIWFRLYSAAMAVLGMYFAVQNILFVIRPDLCFVPILKSIPSMNQRVVYPMWCIMCAVIRIGLSYTTMSCSFIRRIQESISEISEDAFLMHRFGVARRNLYLSNILGGVFVVSIISSSLGMYHTFYREKWLREISDPFFYLFLTESLVLSTAWVGCYNLLALVACGVLRTLFHAILDDITECLSLNDDHGLKMAMQRHNICWRLTDTYNTVFRVAVGATFTVSVPAFSIVTTQIINMYVNGVKAHTAAVLAFLMFWSGSCIFFTALTCAFCTLVQEAAAAPLRPLLEAPDNDNLAVLRFIQRLSSCKIGFSYFNFFVVQRTTILSVFSLMVTYLIVFLQMAQTTSFNPHGGNATSSLSLRMY